MISAAEPAVGRQSLSSPFWASHFVGYGRVITQPGNQRQAWNGGWLSVDSSRVWW